MWPESLEFVCRDIACKCQNFGCFALLVNLKPRLKRPFARSVITNKEKPPIRDRADNEMSEMCLKCLFRPIKIAARAHGMPKVQRSTLV